MLLWVYVWRRSKKENTWAQLCVFCSTFLLQRYEKTIVRVLFGQKGEKVILQAYFHPEERLKFLIKVLRGVLRVIAQCAASSLCERAWTPLMRLVLCGHASIDSSFTSSFTNVFFERAAGNAASTCGRCRSVTSR